MNIFAPKGGNFPFPLSPPPPPKIPPCETNQWIPSPFSPPLTLTFLFLFFVKAGKMWCFVRVKRSSNNQKRKFEKQIAADAKFPNVSSSILDPRREGRKKKKIYCRLICVFFSTGKYQRGKLTLWGRAPPRSRNSGGENIFESNDVLLSGNA